MMKKYFLSLSFLIFSFTLFSQTHLQKFTVSAGFGFQQYCGDLGNGLYRFNSTEYGVASLSVDYSLNKSLEIKFLGTLGDLGYCQPDRPEELNDDHVDHHHEGEHEHGQNPEEENLNSRMASGVFALQYNLANGYILSEESRIAPYVYAGTGINRLTDRMEMECIVPGVYFTANMGAGFRYKLTSSIFAGYQLSFGFFTSDGLDFIDNNKNDLYMQNSAMVGYAF